MQVTAAHKRLILRWIWKNKTGTLEDAIWDLFATDRVSDIKSGKSITQTGDPEGFSATYSFLRRISPLDMAELAGELLDEYTVVSSLIGGSPTDQQIYDEMLDRMQPITEFTKDYSAMRFTGGPV